MSVASERLSMRSALMGYSLMSAADVAEFLDCHPRTAKRRLEGWGVPDVGGKYDPVDVCAAVLAEREGVSFDEYWSRHGEAVADHARRYIQRIRKATAA